MHGNSQALLERHDRIELESGEYRINNNHKVYIHAVQIARSKDIFDDDKIEVLVPLLFVDEIPQGEEMQAVLAYFELFADKHASKERAVFDIVQDLDYIFAGFMQAYGIDLDETDLPIEKFVALLKGLPSDTRLADIIKIRTMKVPKPTKNNAEQINAIMKAKANFALKTENESPWRGFAKVIKEWAEHGR